MEGRDEKEADRFGDEGDAVCMENCPAGEVECDCLCGGGSDAGNWGGSDVADRFLADCGMESWSGQAGSEG